MRHAAPSILALDLGTTTGWALYAQGKIVSGSYELRQSQYEGGGMRFLRFRKEFLNPLRAAREVVFEQVHRHEGTRAAHIYGGLWATLAAWCEENTIPYTGIEVAHWKKTVTGKGNAGKPVIVAAIKKRGYEPKDENEADALGILIHHITKGGQI